VKAVDNTDSHKGDIDMKLFLVCIVALTFLGCMTTIPTLENQTSLSEVKEFSGISKDEIHSKVVRYISKTYNSANNVIQLNDKDNGQIVVVAVGSIPLYMYDRYFDYTMLIDIKDDKIRIQFDNIQSKQIGDVTGPDMNNNWNKIKEYLENIKSGIYSEIENSKKIDNW
jgi:hypothetical protein